MVKGVKIVVIGGGIAGISIAAELSRDHVVTLLEMEQQLAHHTTGRSAALYLGSYGNSNIQTLTRDSFDIYTELSNEYGYPLLTPRGMVQILDHLGVEYGARDILEDARIRQVLSGWSDWPTIPQLFLDGKLVGGCDIVTELFQDGELQPMLQQA